MVKYANCFKPFVTSYINCPAMLVKQRKHIISRTKKELKSIRTIGFKAT